MITTTHDHATRAAAALAASDLRRRTRRRRRLVSVCCVALAPAAGGIFAGSANGAPGALDAAFGDGGKVVTDASPGQTDRAEGIAIQGDGKILAVGADAKLVRYNRNGTLDTTFDGDGIVDTDLAGHDVAALPNGKIVVVGASGGSFAIARYDADGALDTSFGTGGRTLTAFTICQLGDCGTDAGARRIAIAADGAIVVAGAVTQTIFGSSFGHVGVARYTAGGALDSAFGNGGTNYVTVDPNVDSVGLALQQDGKIVVATGKSGDFFFARFLGSGPSAGALDPGFGTAGSTSVDIGGADTATDVAVRGNTIVAAGSSFNGPADFDFALARLRDSDGGVDASFGSAGRVSADFGARDQAHALAVQSDGKLVVAGVTGPPAGGPSDFALARFTAQGAPDASFGAGGKVTTTLSGGADGAADAAIQPADGRIVLAGFATPGGAGQDFALARYDALPAGLRLTATASPDPVQTGGILTYTLTVTNGGPADAREVRLTDSLSTRVSPASSSTTAGGCSPAGDARSVSCAIGDLAAGASVTVRIAVKADRAGTAVNLAEVSGALQDPDLTDNAVVTRSTIVVAPASPAGSPGAVAPPAGAQPPAPTRRRAAKAPAKLQVMRSRVRRSARRVSVLALITRRASGRARVEYLAAGRRMRFDEPIRNGRIAFTHPITRSQANADGGILTISYPGDRDTRPQKVRLRAASRAPNLRASRPRLANGRLHARGTLTRRARGHVRVQIEYVVAATTRTVEFKAPIDNGRWSLNSALPQTVRNAIAKRTGTVHSYTLFTGYAPARIRGQMRSYQILGNR